jgi:hypothetical protein
MPIGVALGASPGRAGVISPAFAIGFSAGAMPGMPECVLSTVPVTEI